MFGLGIMEIVVILVVALVVLGPDNLPKVMRNVGKGLGEFRRVSTELQRTLNTELADTPASPEKEELPADNKKASLPKEYVQAEVADIPGSPPQRLAPRRIPQGHAGNVRPQVRKKILRQPVKPPERA